MLLAVILGALIVTAKVVAALFALGCLIAAYTFGSYARFARRHRYTHGWPR